MNSQVRHSQSALNTRTRLPFAEAIAVTLSAAIFAVRGDEPVVAVVPEVDGVGVDDVSLPCGPFLPREHDTLEAGLRSWVHRQTALDLGFAQQLFTFGDQVELASEQTVSGPRVLSICYLALVGSDQQNDRGGATWRSWYTFFPWEDWRQGKPECLTSNLEPRLKAWAGAGRLTDGKSGLLDRGERLRIAFGSQGTSWDEEKVLERYELLEEAGLIGHVSGSSDVKSAFPKLCHLLAGDHARVLASAIGTLRRTIKYRPVVFELMPAVFTLFELQKTVEAILGPHLHKQNFRRLVEGCGLVEPTGDYRLRTGGRPAQLFRFRRNVLLERLAPGVRVKAGRA